jgi:hypothetical protein
MCRPVRVRGSYRPLTYPRAYALGYLISRLRRWGMVSTAFSSRPNPSGAFESI